MRRELIRIGDAVAPAAMGALRKARDAVRAEAALESEPWFIDRLAVGDGAVELVGWAFPPASAAPRFTVNGAPFDRFERRDRPDVGGRFWQRRDARSSGVAGEKRIAANDAFAHGFLRVSYANPPVPLPAGLSHDWFLPEPARERALPGEGQRLRVIGNADAAGFTLTGATDFKRLEGALAAHAGRGFEGFESILDWGCGCGRVARYAARERGFSGCDIDRESVAWCAANLPGDYVASAMAPPLPFADASFDLLYGVSIFTHLREPLQDRWLAELRRVLRPGGIALVTVHGRTAIEYAGLDPARRKRMLAALRSGGFLLGGKNDQLDGAVEGAAEYFNVFHAPEYVRRRWPRWLAVRAIVPGYLYTHDLVILERLADAR